jgi:malate dehydrogenase (oxaloacetate-decarboxylating)(NADP+)
MCLALGVARDQVTLVDSRGVVHSERTDLNTDKQQFAVKTMSRSLEDAVRGAEVFIGVTRSGQSI